jgi:tetratricopeptide (TPR) repeat protein
MDVHKEKESSIFYYYKSKALLAGSSGLIEKALFYTYEAARMAFLSGLGLKESICYDPELDNMLSKFGLAMRENHASKEPPGIEQHKSIGYIASQLWDTGGHCEALMQWANCLRSEFDRQYVYLTNVSGTPSNFAGLAKKLRSIGVVIRNLPHWGSFEKRINLLVELLNRDRLQHLALFIHPEDVITVTALSKLGRKPPTLFFNHTDRNFWLGRNVIDYLVDWRKVGSEFSKKNRKISNSCIVPLTTNMKPTESQKSSIGIPDDCTLSLSVGYFYKITCDDDYDYFGTIETILARHPNHYHVLLTNKPEGGDIDSYLCGSKEIRKRFIIRELQADLTPYYGAADFLIETFPNIGGTIRTEAMACAIPIVAFHNVKTTMISDTDALDPSYPYMSETEEEVIKDSSLFIENSGLRRNVGRELNRRFQGYFSPEKIRGLLVDILSGTQELSIIEPVTNYRIGDLVDEDYVIYDILKADQERETYLAYSMGASIPIVLKILKKSKSGLPGGTERILYNIRRWMAISDHPNINNGIFARDAGDYVVLGTDYCITKDPDISTLSDYLKERPPDLVQSIKWMIQVCQAMEHANAQGIKYHGNIKPSNILIGPAGTPRLTDYGIAPSHPYVAPEPLSAYDARSDVYLVGLILLRISLGLVHGFDSREFEQGFKETTRNHFLTAAENVLDELIQASSPYLKPVVKRCLDPEPSRRYPSLTSLKRDLENIQKEIYGERPALVAEASNELQSWCEKGLGLKYLCRYREALAFFDRIIANNSSYESVMQLRGECLEAAGDLDGALQAYEGALANENTNNGVLRKIGNVLDEKGVYDKAIKHYQQELAVNPSDPECMLDMAVALAINGHREDATEIITSATDRLFADASEITNLDRYWEELVLSKISLHCLSRIKSIDPNSPSAWVNMGDTFFSFKQYDGAYQCYKEASTRESGSLTILNRMCSALIELGLFDEAMKTCEIVVGEDPRNADAWFNKGRIFMLREDEDQASHCIDVALELDPQISSAYLYRGSIAIHKGFLDDALECYEAVIEIYPGNIEALLHKGDILISKGFLDDALKCYEAVIEIDPGNNLALIHKTDILKIQNRE